MFTILRGSSSSFEVNVIPRLESKDIEYLCISKNEGTILKDVVIGLSNHLFKFSNCFFICTQRVNNCCLVYIPIISMKRNPRCLECDEEKLVK
jgi:hypothetical protein